QNWPARIVALKRYSEANFEWTPYKCGAIDIPSITAMRSVESHPLSEIKSKTKSSGNRLFELPIGDFLFNGHRKRAFSGGY
ncbi:MAG: hypothetical protein ACKO9H_08120, partial [Planctomycetota bacterium]